jgi:hypothetical protein
MVRQGGVDVWRKPDLNRISRLMDAGPENLTTDRAIWRLVGLRSAL